MRAIGWHYQEGQGVDRDFGEAKSWYDKAAVNGDLEAEAMLGQLYQQGRGVSRNIEIARQKIYVAKTVIPEIAIQNNFG